MSEQRRIDLLFAATVRVKAFGRASLKAGPYLGMGLVTAVAVHGTLGGMEGVVAGRVAIEQPPTVATVAASGPQPLPAATVVAEGQAPTEVVPAVVAPAPAPRPVVETRPAPQLDREQQNIARFIAARYRVTLEATSEFVHHAYRTARDVKLDPMLILAVMSVESSFNPKAQSHAGAQGLMQVLTRVHVDRFMPFGGIPAAFDPVANIRVGSSILKEYLLREGSVEGALKSYVGAALAEHDGGYGMKVLNARERIAAAAAGRPIPPEVTVVQRRPEPQREQDEPTFQPVSTIVETRTPIYDEPRQAPEAPAASADHRYPAAAPRSGGDI
jgi:soluble lytic murein transglycosylase-like protein